MRRAGLVVILTLAGCERPPEPHDPFEWRNLSQVFHPVRVTTFPPRVASDACLIHGMSVVIGHADGATIQQLVATARQRHPEAAILSVRSHGRHAEVQTLRCDRDREPPEAGGHVLLFRNEYGVWRFKEEQPWTF